MQENGLIRKLRLISKFITSSTLKQIIKIQILTNTSRSNDNKTMKLGQLIEYNVKNIFLQNSCTKWGTKTSFRPLFVFKKASYKVKASVQNLSLNVLVVLVAVVRSCSVKKVFLKVLQNS